MINKIQDILNKCDDFYSGYTQSEEYYLALQKGNIVAKIAYSITTSSDGWDWRNEYYLSFLDVDVITSCEGDNENVKYENEELYGVCEKVKKMIQERLEERDREWKKSPPLGHIVSNYMWFETNDKRFVKIFFGVQKYILRHSKIGKGFNFIFPYSIGKKDKIVMFEAREVWETDSFFGYHGVYINSVVRVYYSFSERKYTYEIFTPPYDFAEEDYSMERAKSEKRWQRIAKTLNTKFLLN